MSGNRRFNLTEWVESKKNRNIALIVVVVLLAIALTARVVSQIKGIGEESKLPKSGLIQEQGDYVERELPYYLNSSMSNASLGVSLALPEGMGISGDNLMFISDDVTYIVGDSADGVKKISETLYADAVKSLFGTQDKISVGKVESGFLGYLPAEFCTASVDMQVSTKDITLYSIAYVVSVSDISGVSNRKLVLYACSENAESLNEAQVVLKEIAYSARKLDMSVFEEEEEEKTPFTAHYYPIDVYWLDGSKGYSNTVMLIVWYNTSDAPDKLTITGPEGQIGVLNEEYSMTGHYVYEFGVTHGGEYHLVGETQKQLMEVSIGVMSMTDYLNTYHYFEVNDDMPDYILDRDNGDAEYYEENYGEQ